MRIAVHAHTDIRVVTGTVSIGYPRIVIQCCSFSAYRGFDGFLRVQRDRMVQLQVRELRCHQLCVGQTGTRVFAGITGNIYRFFHCQRQRRRTKVSGRCAAFMFAHIHADPQSTIVGELNIFHFAHTGRHRNAFHLRHTGFSLCGTFF